MGDQNIEIESSALSLRLFAEPKGCVSKVKLVAADEPGPGLRKSMYDFVARNRLLLPIVNFSRFLSLSELMELIFDNIFMFGVFCKLFKLSKEYLSEVECLRVLDLIPQSTFLLFPPLGASSEKISDIFCTKDDKLFDKMSLLTLHYEITIDYFAVKFQYFSFFPLHKFSLTLFSIFDLQVSVL